MSLRRVGAPAARVLCAAGTLAAALSGFGSAGCGRKEFWPGPQSRATSTSRPSSLPSLPAAPLALGPAAGSPFEIPFGAHPRLVLTSERLADVAALRKSGAPSWNHLLERCALVARETIDGGYEDWDWANASLDSALCYRVTGNASYGAAAIRYFGALLDDRVKVGDHAGGDSVVRHDDGYSIRTHAALGAIALDWLWDAPGMTDSLKKRAADRIASWTSWFKENGYNRDAPISNYYAGYFGAVAFGGIALGGYDPRAADLRSMTHRMWNEQIVPTYRAKLEGGDFPEGWQYGSLVGAIFTLYADAEERAAPSKVAKGGTVLDQLAWLRASVSYHAHALLPDARHVEEEGDWDEKPPRPTTHELMALALVLPADDKAAKTAAFLWRLARDAHDEPDEWLWLDALADARSKPGVDSREGARSYFAKGTELVTMRTDWSRSAVFSAIASAPTLSDHQHLDAGHFAIVRGEDQLVIDSGAYGSYSSMSHNTILVDAETTASTYSPNQGTWSDSARIARFEDAGAFVYALADYASAYNPSGYPKDNPLRAVSRAEREYVFSREPIDGAPESARIVIYDRLTVLKPTYQTIWLCHPGEPPHISGPVSRVTVGSSVAEITTLLPISARPLIVAEPTPNTAERPFFENSPPEGKKSMRIEVRSPRDGSNVERRFLNVIAVGPAGRKTALADAIRLEGEFADGAAVGAEGYVFTMGGPHVSPLPLAWTAPVTVIRHLVFGLAQTGKYQLTAIRVAGGCKLSLAPGGDRAASPQGTMTLEVHDCVIAR